VMVEYNNRGHGMNEYVLLYAYTLLDYIFTELEIHAKTPNEPRKWLQGYAVVALWIAADLYSFVAPVIDEAVFICSYAYSRKELMEIKTDILTHFEFNLSFPTVGDHIRRMADATTSPEKYRLAMLYAAKIMTTADYFTNHRDRLQNVAVQAIQEASCPMKPEFDDVFVFAPTSIEHPNSPKTKELDETIAALMPPPPAAVAVAAAAVTMTKAQKKAQKRKNRNKI